MGPVEFVELGRPHGEHGAALEDLDLHAHLEHVGGRGHRDVGLLRLGEHLPDGVGRARLDARLVDRSDDNVGRPHRERRRGRPGRRDPARRADPRRRRRNRCCACSRSRSASMVGSRTIAGWLSVWPPESASAVTSSAIGIRRGPFGLLRRDLAGSTSSRRNFAGGGARNFEATSTRETLAMIRFGATISPDSSRCRPVHPVADDRQRQVEIRRRLDQPDAALEVKVGDRRLEAGLVRAVDQVEAVRRSRRPERSSEPVDRRLDTSAAASPPRRRCRASPRGPSPRRSRPSRSRWPSRRNNKESASHDRRQNAGSPRRSGQTCGQIRRHRTGGERDGVRFPELVSTRPVDDEERIAHPAQRLLQGHVLRRGDHHRCRFASQNST